MNISTFDQNIKIAVAAEEAKLRGGGIGPHDIRPINRISLYTLADAEREIFRLSYAGFVSHPGARKPRLPAIFSHWPEGKINLTGIRDGYGEKLQLFLEGGKPFTFQDPANSDSDVPPLDKIMAGYLAEFWFANPDNLDILTAFEFDEKNYTVHRGPISPEFAKVGGSSAGEDGNNYNDEQRLDLILSRLVNVSRHELEVGGRIINPGEQYGFLALEGVHLDTEYARSAQSSYFLVSTLSGVVTRAIALVQGKIQAKLTADKAPLEIVTVPSTPKNVSIITEIESIASSVVSKAATARKKGAEDVYGSDRNYANLAIYPGEMDIATIRSRLLTDDLQADTIAATKLNIANRLVEAGIYKSRDDVSLWEIMFHGGNLKEPHLRKVGDSTAGLDELLGPTLEGGEVIRVSAVPLVFDPEGNYKGGKNLSYAQLFPATSEEENWKASIVRAELASKARNAIFAGKSSTSLLKFGKLSQEQLAKGTINYGGKEVPILNLISSPELMQLYTEMKTTGDLSSFEDHPLVSLFNDVHIKHSKTIGNGDNDMGYPVLEVPSVGRNVQGPGWIMWTRNANTDHSIWNEGGELNLGVRIGELLSEAHKRERIATGDPLAEAYDPGTKLYRVGDIKDTHIKKLIEAADRNNQLVAVLSTVTDGTLTSPHFPSGDKEVKRSRYAVMAINAEMARAEQRGIAYKLGVLDEHIYKSGSPEQVEEALAKSKVRIYSMIDDRSADPYHVRRHMVVFEPHPESYSSMNRGKAINPARWELSALVMAAGTAVADMHIPNVKVTGGFKKEEQSLSISGLGYILNEPGNTAIVDRATQWGAIISSQSDTYRSRLLGATSDLIDGRFRDSYWDETSGVPNAGKQSEYNYARPQRRDTTLIRGRKLVLPTTKLG